MAVKVERVDSEADFVSNSATKLSFGGSRLDKMNRFTDAIIGT